MDLCGSLWIGVTMVCDVNELECGGGNGWSMD